MDPIKTGKDHGKRASISPAVVFSGTVSDVVAESEVRIRASMLSFQLLKELCDSQQHLLGGVEVISQLAMLFLQLVILLFHLVQLLRKILVSAHQLAVLGLQGSNVLRQSLDISVVCSQDFFYLGSARLHLK
jgi:hypothetical protein